MWEVEASNVHAGPQKLLQHLHRPRWRSQRAHNLSLGPSIPNNFKYLLHWQRKAKKAKGLCVGFMREKGFLGGSFCFELWLNWWIDKVLKHDIYIGLFSYYCLGIFLSIPKRARKLQILFYFLSIYYCFGPKDFPFLAALCFPSTQSPILQTR